VSCEVRTELICIVQDKYCAMKHYSNGILLFQGFCCEGLHNVLDGHCFAARRVTQQLTEIVLFLSVIHFIK
jgi:hypothetical protein